MHKRYDVIVIGAGPSGSTAANLLAQRGLSVLALERQRFPRFHIGESLLPIDLPLFTRLGLDPSTQGFVRKVGAEFLDESIGARMCYPFADALPGTPDHAYQVERSVFDHWLSRRAEEVGAEIHFDERVLACDVQEGHVSLTTSSASYEARYVVDASGQDAFFGRRDRSVELIEDFGLAAAFTHFHLPLIDIPKGVMASWNCRQVGRPRRQFDIQIQRRGGVALDRPGHALACTGDHLDRRAAGGSVGGNRFIGKIPISRRRQLIPRRQIDPELEAMH